MAQAARLNLRMQKELKLLMTDPPHGVSIPLLCDSDTSSSSSLTSIEARVEGPEDTVYSKGVFTIKIQIPERYPFHPPNVTFATPIYHPNVDTGGRICLDILNLPPKGAWQPSLNISTVLTSIGLLLSEPNPDDGLMAEASREYKYNRQAFDQKARSWTEKYANARYAAQNNTGSSSSKSPSMELNVEVKKVETSSGNVNNDTEGCRKRLRLSGAKLSLKPKLVPNIMNNNDKENAHPNRKLSLSRSQMPTVVDPSSSVISEHSKFNTKDEKQAKENVKEIVTIIVSDSEESDEDERPFRSRLSLLKKKMVGKWVKP